MELQIEKILDLYDQKIAEMNRKIILLTLENNELKTIIQNQQKDE